MKAEKMKEVNDDWGMDHDRKYHLIESMWIVDLIETGFNTGLHRR